MIDEKKDMDPSMHAHAAISDCIFGDKRWTEPKKHIILFPNNIGQVIMN